MNDERHIYHLDNVSQPNNLKELVTAETPSNVYSGFVLHRKIINIQWLTPYGGDILYISFVT